jgi:2-dehydropantoate 2-reductase
MTQSPAAPAPQSVAVVGLGAIGGVAAAALQEAGRHTVTACVRRPLERLVFERPGGTVDLRLRALTDPAEAEPVDWVLLCTKAQETPSAAPWLQRLCRPSTHVAVLQNGIDHAARVAPYSGGATAVPVIVYYNGERLAPDHVRFRPVGAHELVTPDDEAGRAFAQLMQGTPLRVLPTADFATRAWRKLLLNIVANPITALTLQRQAVMRHKDVYALGLDILQEAVAVARADGVRLADDEAARSMATLMSYSPELGTSMYFDRLAGRPVEIEALNGAVVAAGARHGIATPLNRMLLALMRAINDAPAEAAK